jgi:site-specific DNA-methyltransferase (adenine-specific)
MLKLDNIYHGDCLELIQQIPDHSIDTVITDLPYGISYQSNRATHGRKNSPKFDVIANDEKPFIDFIKYLPRVIKPTSAIYLFTRWDVQQPVIDELQANGMKVKNVLIWDKGVHSMGDLYTAYGMRYESIVFSSMPDFRFQNGRPVDIIACNKVFNHDLVHPNEKPVDLLRRLILDSTPEMGTVLDCTCGSGTTLLAAIEEKRHYIGFEIDEKYYNIASRRIKDLLAYPKMF